MPSSEKSSAAPWHDSTLALLVHGYAWLPNRMRRSIDGTVRTRLMGRPAIALRGPDAVSFFYDEKHVVRTAALPGPVLDTLFGQGAVHTLDGDAHRVRKAMFIALLKDGAGVAALHEHVTRQWREAMAGGQRDRVMLFDEVAKVLTFAVRDWAGVPLSDPAAADLARDCTSMVDGFATPGPRRLRARRARRRQEDALAGLIIDARNTPETDSPGSALETVAWHRDLLRADTGGSYAEAFAHEVRRFYPFAPFVAGLAARDLTWHGEHLPKDALVLLDLYGHNHDPALWVNPYRFDPRRFAAPEGLQDPLDNLLPQGGGDPAHGHRCPGEDITVTALAAIATELAQLDYEVPAQDLGIPLSRVPTLPRSGFELRLR